jgi:hypothetical protein
MEACLAMEISRKPRLKLGLHYVADVNGCCENTNTVLSNLLIILQVSRAVVLEDI